MAICSKPKSLKPNWKRDPQWSTLGWKFWSGLDTASLESFQYQFQLCPVSKNKNKTKNKSSKYQHVQVTKNRLPFCHSLSGWYLKRGPLSIMHLPTDLWPSQATPRLQSGTGVATAEPRPIYAALSIHSLDALNSYIGKEKSSFASQAAELSLNLTTITAVASMAPSHHKAIGQDASKSKPSCLNLLLLLHLATVTASARIAPSHHRAISQNGSESTVSCLNLLDLHQLLSHLSTVTTSAWIAPGHHRAVSQNGSKSKPSCLNLLDLHQMLSNLSAESPQSRQPKRQQKHTELLECAGPAPTALAPVTTSAWIAPSHHRAIGQDGSKSTVSCLNLLDLHQLLSYLATVTEIALAKLRPFSVTRQTQVFHTTCQSKCATHYIGSKILWSGFCGGLVAAQLLWLRAPP